jgi:hypothetical protein
MSQIIRTHLTVDASVETVWQTLLHLAGYRTWNPFITAAAGDVAIGERLDLIIEPPGGRPQHLKPWVTALQPLHYLEWLGRLAMPGILDGRHSFTLTRMAGARTLLQQSETFTGMLVPVTRALRTQTRAGFIAMNTALAEEAKSATGGFAP